MSNVLSYILCFGWLPLFLMGLLGLLLGWLLFGRNKGHAGDLTIEGEGALRAEADGLRARIQDLEGRLSTSDGEVSSLKSQLAAAGTGAAVAAVASGDGDDDETYALEWRNRYLAARVKYLEGKLAEAPKAKARKKPAAKKAPAKKTTRKKAPAKKATAKKAAAPKVLYTDGPTDGAPDDLKLIKGIGPKFEKDLNGKGIYYFRQIAAWKKKDVDLVENVIDSIPGRIQRDEWIPQAKKLSSGGSAKPAKARKKPGPKPGTKRGATNKDGTPRKKPGPKPAAKKAAPAKKTSGGLDYDKYYANVKKFDGRAARAKVDNIVKYLGASLKSRDASLVACSDPSELDTVVKNFCVKKLGISKAKGDEIVKTVCQDMKSERFKNRVTFYYLCAKKAGKLSVFS